MCSAMFTMLVDIHEDGALIILRQELYIFLQLFLHIVFFGISIESLFLATNVEIKSLTFIIVGTLEHLLQRFQVKCFFIHPNGRGKRSDGAKDFRIKYPCVDTDKSPNRTAKHCRMFTIVERSIMLINVRFQLVNNVV